MALKTGKLPHAPDERDLRFSAYLTPQLPTPPAKFGYTGRPRWGMLGNDAYGDCVWAGAAHETKLWNLVNKRRVSFEPKGVLSDYSAVTGFDPANPGSDQGTDVRQAMGYRRGTGIVDSRGKRHKIGAYVLLDRNWDHLVAALYLFGAVGIGVIFPDSAMQQFNSGEPWDVAQFTDSNEGHYIPAIAADHDSITVVTWGTIQTMTRRFYEFQADEAWVPFSPELLASGKSPQGFDAGQLATDLSALSRKTSTPTPGGSMKTPDITPAQVVAVLTTVVGLFVTQGLVSNGTGKFIGGLASVLIPFAWVLADSIIRHGRARALGVAPAKKSTR